MKRIISFLLSLVIIIIPVCYTASAAESVTPMLTRLDRELLSVMGLLVNDGDDTPVKRGTYAGALAGIIGMEYTEDDAAFYKDMVRHSDEGELAFDGYVKYGEVICGLLTALGYDAELEFSGQGAQGYLRKAQSLEISTGIMLGFDDYVSQEQLNVLIARALQTPMMIKASYGTAFVTEVDEDKTLLTEYHDIYNGEGKITANELSSLSGPGGMRSGEVRIGDSFTAYVGETDAEFLLGYMTEYYYKHSRSSNENTLIAIYADPEENRELYLPSDKIDGYESGVYKYYYNDKVKKAPLEGSTAFIYNGVATGAAALTADQMVPKTGEVTLLDTNRNGKCDVVLIMDYTADIFEAYDATYERLYLRKSTKELAEIKKMYIFDTEYNTLAMSDIQRGAVIWTATPIGGEYMTMLVSDETVSGKVTATGRLNGKTYFEIGGEKYGVGAYFDENRISVGSEGTFSLDADNRIADFNVQSGALLGGEAIVYAIDAALTGTFGNELMLRVFDGDEKSYTCRERIVLNGESYSEHSKLYSALLNGKAAFESQLMIIKTNDENQICEIETAAPKYDPTQPDRIFIEGQTPREGEGTAVMYRAGDYYGNMVMNYFALEDDAKIFMVPEDKSDISEYYLGTPADIADGIDVYGLTGYKIGDDTVRCLAAVYESSASGGPQNQEYVVITEISEGVGEEGEPVMIVGYHNLNTDRKGNAVVEREEIIDKLSVGDIVNMDITSQNVVQRYSIIYSYKDDEILTANNGGHYYGNRWMRAEVVKKMNNAVKIKSESVPVSYIENELLLLDRANAAIYIIDDIRGNISSRKGTPNDIMVGDKIMYFEYRGSNLKVFLYKK